MNNNLKKKSFFQSYQLLLLLSSLVFTSCEEIFEDTDLNPIYFIECEMNGETFRAQTNNNASMHWFATPMESELVVNGNISSQDKIFNFNMFPSLGATRVPVGTNVNSYLSNISYFHDDKDYSALESGGDGYVDFEILTATNAEGTFEATLVNREDLSDIIEITNGKFKVKVKTN
ncbi:hypothetical protein [uncultured Arcticibacterium sp.]|uniref:hypothetical protein n=1 Tax=uncultured Arcticibacterium sp. TaxID=2173042 RepID=UPI0030FCBB20